MKRISFSILLGLLLCIAPSVHAQVTIGMGKEPNAGSLLDLKSQDADANNVNATKGLGMPRVNLTTISPAVGALAASIGGTGTWDETAHIGLTVYNVNQCLKEASGIATGAGPFVWDGVQWQALLSDVAGVIRHPAKAGVYEEFTSANFGTAGRWMTTNLSAKAYDGIPHSQGRSLLGPPSNNNTTNLYNVAYWAYPNVAGASPAGPMDATEYNKNKALGYLYTWDAATAGKGGATGQLGGNEVGTNHANPQGICPQGWHLPSDYEWSLLEREIVKNTLSYANVANNIDNGNGIELAKVPLDGTQQSTWRGTTHGTAMKEVCETLSSTDPAGASKPASQGGFSAPLAGYANSGSSLNFGDLACFWSSSSSNTNYAWVRFLHFPKGGVSEGMDSRGNLFSVRCKKD